jgi:putative DNA primase/helicase
MADPMPPLEAFDHIEYAIGAANHRNNICRFEDFTPPADAVDTFTTWFRYTDDLQAYLSTHHNAKGNPSIEGYAGPAFAHRFVTDFDSADDLALAQRDAVTLITRLGERFDVPPGAIHVYFSGSKGFALEIPGSLFGGFGPAPAPQLADRLKALASILGEGLTTLDFEIYQRVRLWRWPNTINSKSGLYKVPLTVHELQTLDIAAIRELATQSRSIAEAPDDDWEAIPDLVAVWREAQDQTQRRRTRVVDQRATRRFKNGQADRLIALVSPHYHLGRKHDLAVSLAGYLAVSGFSEDETLKIIETIASDDTRPADRANAVKSTYARHRAGDPIRGYSGLKTLILDDELAFVAQLVLDAETITVAGGRPYRKAAAGDQDAEPTAKEQEPDQDETTDDEQASHDDGDAFDDADDAEDASANDDNQEAGILGDLKKRATDAPETFAREMLAEPDTLGALAKKAREDRPAYESFLLELREQGVPAGAIKRIERVVNDALRRGRSKFRVAGPDEELDAPLVKDALPHAPVTDWAVVPFGYRLTASGIIEESLNEDGERRTIPVAPVPIVLTGRMIDVADGKEAVRVSWMRDGRWRDLTADRSTLANARDLVGLSSVGFPVTSRTAGDLVGYAAAYEAANIGHLPRARVSRQLGWQGDDGSLGFLLGRSLIRADGEETGDINLDAIPPDEWDAEWVAFHGSGEGADQLVDAFGRAGSFEGWVEAAALASRYPRVALAMYASLATPLLDVLGAPNFVIDWSFETSTGKTTTLRLGGSCWGNPDEHAAASVVNTWDATRVWIERASETLNCLPLILDDTARAKQPKMVAQTIYDVAQGRGRGRGSPHGMRRSGTWATILLSTGEAPATSFTEDGGTRARTLVLWGPPFGKSDETTAPIVNQLGIGIRQNYGHAGPRIVRYLVKHRDQWDLWRERYKAVEQRYLDHAGSNPVAGRLSRYFALLDASALLAHRALDLPWNYEHTVDALWADLVHEASDADRARAAMNLVVSWAQANSHAFEGRLDIDREGNPKRPISGVAGKWERSLSWETIAFYPHKIKELLEQAGHQPESILRTWRDRDWLETAGDSKRATKSVRIQGERAWAIVIKRSAIEEGEEKGHD